MKRTILLILCAMMLFSAALAETATATVDGVGEHVTVTLTMDGDRIISVEASSDYTEADNPEGLALTKKSNLETYGNEMGPTTDQLYEKYGSWQTVLEKALGANVGMDACLGFYDEYYDFYDIGVQPMDGNWVSVPHEAAALPVDAQAAFDKATEGKAEYLPVALLSSQVVAGTNYCVLCQVKAGDAAGSWALVYIHADPEGNATITNVYELYIDRHSTPAE